MRGIYGFGRHNFGLHSNVCHGPVGKVVGGLVGGGGGGNVTIPKAEEVTPAPTTDDARIAAEDELQRDRRKGRLSTYLTPTNTGEQLSTPSGGGSLKRYLGGAA